MNCNINGQKSQLTFVKYQFNMWLFGTYDFRFLTTTKAKLKNINVVTQWKIFSLMYFNIKLIVRLFLGQWHLWDWLWLLLELVESNLVCQLLEGISSNFQSKSGSSRPSSVCSTSVLMLVPSSVPLLHPSLGRMSTALVIKPATLWPLEFQLLWWPLLWS